MAPSDFYLFLLLKEHQRDEQYESDNDVIQSVEHFLQRHYKLTLIYRRRIRWTELHKDYVEK